MGVLSSQNFNHRNPKFKHEIPGIIIISIIISKNKKAEKINLIK